MHGLASELAARLDDGGGGLTHFRVKNPPLKMLLSAVLLVCSLAAAYLNYRLNFPM